MDNQLPATEVSMSWDYKEFRDETTYDSDFAHPGTFCFAAVGDEGHEAEYPV